MASPKNTDLWNEFKRQGIQQAVIRLMCREGLKSVTMERVAQETGIAKGTVYLHYRDKQELLEAVKDSALAPLTEKLHEILVGAASPERKLRALVLRYLTYFDEKRDLFRILLYEREVTRVMGERYQTDRYRNLIDGTARVIRDGVRKRVFRNVDARHVAAMFIESTVALMNQRLLDDSPRPVEDDAELVADIFLAGLAPVAARRRGAA
ncbi:MAG TPA: TetR/AcrR family transcriptional regulator [Thermoanaerobaculia bacterium]|nr:TetR/AcrR family transcriptional regulator [Thermoanaerobaculia bacterium]